MGNKVLTVKNSLVPIHLNPNSVEIFAIQLSNLTNRFCFSIYACCACRRKKYEDSAFLKSTNLVIPSS